MTAPREVDDDFVLNWARRTAPPPDPETFTPFPGCEITPSAYVGKETITLDQWKAQQK